MSAADRRVVRLLATALVLVTPLLVLATGALELLLAAVLGVALLAALGRRVASAPRVTV